MDKRLILNKYSKPEEKLLISKMIDKIELTTNKNKIQNTDFLDIYQSHLLEKILKQEKVENYIINGGISDSERNIIVFFPEKLSEIVNTNTSKILPIKCIRIKLIIKDQIVLNIYSLLSPINSHMALLNTSRVLNTSVMLLSTPPISIKMVFLLIS